MITGNGLGWLVSGMVIAPVYCILEILYNITNQGGGKPGPYTASPGTENKENKW